MKHLEILNNKDEFDVNHLRPFIFAKHLKSLQSLTFFYLNLDLL